MITLSIYESINLTIANIEFASILYFCVINLMIMATIHPYKGYLNTKFHFYAKGSEVVSYTIVSLNEESKSSIQTGIFTPNIPYSVSINKAGTYRVDFNDGTSTNIIVEDGYKFGGSKHKRSFIFDNCT